MAQLSVMIEHVLRRELRTLKLEILAYEDESLIWALAPGLPNSAGTLTLHVTGNLQHFIGSVLGRSGYVRDREAEFSTRGSPREALLQQILAADAAIASSLSRLADEELSKPFPEALGGYQLETGDFLLHLGVHLAYHLGQVSYHRRLVTGDIRGVGALPAAELASARAS